MSVLNKIANLKKASAENRRTPMTDAQVKTVSAKLMADNRMNVYPNKFNVKVPFRVQVRTFNTETRESEWSQHGYFTSADVASAVGTIVSAAKFGEKALAGNYDQALVEAHPEFTAWLADARNAEILSVVGM